MFEISINIGKNSKFKIQNYCSIIIWRKLFKIHENIWKNFKNDKINKNTHVKVIF